MPPVEAKSNINNSTKKLKSTSNDATLYSRICEIPPLELLQRLDKEGISTRGGDMPGLRARLLRHELRRVYPETSAALHRDLELVGQEAENWCAMMNLWEIDARARTKMREQQERSCAIVDKKLDDTCSTKKPFENDAIEKNRVDYLLSCMKLLKSWDIHYSGAKGGRDFLESLKDFRKFADIGDQILLLMLPSVLTCEAKAWYRSHNFASWNEFEAAFVQRIAMCSQPRVSPSSMNASTTKVSQVPMMHSAPPDVRSNVEARMSQSFAFGVTDSAANRDTLKPQKSEAEQARPLQLVAPPSRLPSRSSVVEEERRRVREQELHRARYIEYMQQSRLNCTKERFQPHVNVAPTKPEKIDASTEALVPSSSHLECVRKLRLWNVKYSGKRGRTVIEFVEDLSDFRKHTKVSDEVLLEVLPCVLSGDAKRWYRNPSLLGKRWSTWEEFRERFLERFYDKNAAEERLRSIVSEVERL